MTNSSWASKAVLGITIAIVLAFIAAKTFFIGFFTIPQNGMYPALPAGSRIFTSKRAYTNAASVQRGDIIVFQREDGDRHYNYIWRVIALPGEKVETSNDSLLINGRPVQRQRMSESGGKTIFREQIGDVSYEVSYDASSNTRPPNSSVIVPPDHFFVMGDNRFNALDSRYFGPISFGSILGKKL